MDLYEVVTDVASYVGKERIDDLYCMKTERLFESNPESLADVKNGCRQVFITQLQRVHVSVSSDNYH